MTDNRYIPREPLVPGEFYYAADCPTTGKLLLFEIDESRGTQPYPPRGPVATCHHCQSLHRFSHTEVRSLLVPQTE